MRTFTRYLERLKRRRRIGDESTAGMEHLPHYFRLGATYPYPRPKILFCWHPPVSQSAPGKGPGTLSNFRAGLKRLGIGKRTASRR
ncbi:MAG: hypothetical protein JSV26_10630 [bacterium]|nr:MAG: hypothetical protein JSV26_10630 [bacterium]